MPVAPDQAASAFEICRKNNLKILEKVVPISKTLLYNTKCKYNCIITTGTKNEGRGFYNDK